MSLDASIKDYKGPNAKVTDPIHSAVLLENSTFSRNIYRANTVDDVLFDQAYVLQENTAKQLYSDEFPKDINFTKGTRVHLEKLVTKVIDGTTNDEQKAMAILAFVRDIPVNYRHTGNEVIHGGTEEEVIKKGSSMCNEQARVLIVMAQIAGIPARYIGHMTLLDFDDLASGSGHGVSELYFNNQWVYMDIRGIFFKKENGRYTSTWDLIQDPSIIDKQSDEVKSFRFNGYNNYTASKKYFSQTTVHIIAPYQVSDFGDYDYTWVYPSASLWAEAREKSRFIRVTKHKELLRQPSARF